MKSWAKMQEFLLQWQQKTIQNVLTPCLIFGSIKTLADFEPVKWEQMVTIETDIFVMALSLRSGSKVVSKYIMGDVINAERLNSYRDINYYLEM